MCRKILRELFFFLPLPVTGHKCAVPKRQTVCRDGQQGYAGAPVRHAVAALSVHVDRAHTIVIFSNTSMIIKARFRNPEMCGMVMGSTQLITWKAALDREHDKCCNRDRLFLLS